MQRDTVRWAEEVGSLVGPTNILFYPHGGRPDGDDWHSTGPVFQYLQSQGFRIFASVGINSFSYIKKDISAVICDRLHPDGTTLRNGKALEWYSQFYDAREIIDLDVRPDLGGPRAGTPPPRPPDPPSPPTQTHLRRVTNQHDAP